MIDLSMRVSGAQIAICLSDDHEELAYFLDELADDMDEITTHKIAQQVFDCVDGDKVAAFLRALADAIEEADE